MARSKQEKDLIDRLHAGGIRKRSAKLIAGATDGRRKPAKQVRATLNELRKIVDEAEDRISGGPAKRKAAASKAAATRQKNAQRRSTAAKKGARTRARSTS